MNISKIMAMAIAVAGIAAGGTNISTIVKNAPKLKAPETVVEERIEEVRERAPVTPPVTQPVTQTAPRRIHNPGDYGYYHNDHMNIAVAGRSNDEVDAQWDTYRAERRTEYERALNEDVKNGYITEAEKEAYLNSFDNMADGCYGHRTYDSSGNSTGNYGGHHRGGSGRGGCHR